MPIPIQTLIQAVRRKNWHDANEAFSTIMAEKKDTRLAEERKQVHQESVPAKKGK